MQQLPLNGVTHGIPDGHKVIGVDISSVQLEHARQRVTSMNPIARFELGDLRVWLPPPRYRDAGVDAVVSYYALNHLPLEDYVAVIQKISNWLRLGGVLALGTVAGVSGRVRWMGHDVAATGLSLEEIVAIVESTGLKVESSWEEH